MMGETAPDGAGLDYGALHEWLHAIGKSDLGFGAAEVKKAGTFKITELRRTTYAGRVTGLPEGWYVQSATLGWDDAFQKGVPAMSGSAAHLLGVSISHGAA